MIIFFVTNVNGDFPTSLDINSDYLIRINKNSDFNIEGIKMVILCNRIIL